MIENNFWILEELRNLRIRTGYTIWWHSISSEYIKAGMMVDTPHFGRFTGPADSWQRVRLQLEVTSARNVT